MHFTDHQRQQLKYAHSRYIWDHRESDKLGDLLARTPITTGYHKPQGFMHITQRNILVLLHKLGVRYY